MVTPACSPATREPPLLRANAGKAQEHAQLKQAKEHLRCEERNITFLSESELCEYLKAHKGR